MKLFWAFLLLVLIGFQYRIWVGEGSLAEVWSMKAKIQQQELENQALRERNALLKAEVDDLKKGLQAIEERARSELGMIKKEETFYQSANDGQKK
jgi:cell division protein FtsB